MGCLYLDEIRPLDLVWPLLLSPQLPPRTDGRGPCKRWCKLFPGVQTPSAGASWWAPGPPRAPPSPPPAPGAPGTCVRARPCLWFWLPGSHCDRPRWDVRSEDGNMGPDGPSESRGPASASERRTHCTLATQTYEAPPPPAVACRHWSRGLSCFVRTGLRPDGASDLPAWRSSHPNTWRL